MPHSSILMFLLLCILCTGLVGAGSMDELSKANNAFAMDLYKKIGEANTGKNLFFSPISISTAFGVTILGARGKTREQIKAVLHLDKIRSDETVKKAYKQLFTTFKRQNNSYTLHLVNRLFGSNTFQFNQQFLKDVKNLFRASVKSLDFVVKPEESRRHINQWVEKQTNQLIRDLLPDGSITSDTILVIVNAIYFKARWVHLFPERLTKRGPFSISKSEKGDMEIMRMSDDVRLNYHNSSELNCQLLELPYKGRTASMFVFLPHDVEGLPNLEKQLTGENLAVTLSKVRRHNMVVQLPKFIIDQGISLKEFLQTMGMVDIFNKTVANLSGIGGKESDRLFVSDSFHKAFVNVSESGTEAAAATGIIKRIKSVPPPPIRFIANRPFLFMIYEKNTKTVLFMGRLVRPPTAN